MDFARGQNDNDSHYRSILIMIFILNSRKGQKKTGQKMTDNQKSFGGSGRFKIVEPIYYMRPVCRVFLA